MDMTDLSGFDGDTNVASAENASVPMTFMVS